jgi:RND superfamily putative drug exporter
MRRRWVGPAAVVVLWVIVGASLASSQGTLFSVQRNDIVAFLPAGAESTTVLNLDAAFRERETTSSAIVVYARPGGLTAADRAKIAADTRAIVAEVGPELSGPAVGPIYAPNDNDAAQVVLPFAASNVDRLRGEIRDIRARVSSSSGLQAYVAGPVGVVADLTEAFHGVLPVVTGLVLLLILLVVCRGPVLPLLVLLVAGVALSVANGAVYLLARDGVITLSGPAQAIMDALVLGAGTDYALVVVSRLREELRHHGDAHDAMRRAWRATVEPIAASGLTVILALLCLLVSDLPATRGLGVAGAIGIACALLGMLTLLPAALLLTGRAAFWPFRSRPSGGGRRLWARVAGLVGLRPRVVWVSTLLVLLGLSVGLDRLHAYDLRQTTPSSASAMPTVGQDLLARHFPDRTGSPVEIIARSDALDQVVAAAKAVPGVASVAPSPGGGRHTVAGGLARVDATLGTADLPEATIDRLRVAAHAVPGADATVGGPAATDVDVRRAAQRDRSVMVPLVLAVVFVILSLVLRALLAPFLVVLTLLLAFLATLGVSGMVFQDVFGLADEDSSLPLLAFVLVVSLGVEHTVVLMTRVRDQVRTRGHRAATLTSLAATGGVTTSTGIVLAATFSVLPVLPLTFLVEISFAVAFGVLLHALVVRSLLVPAVTVDIGRPVWWPSALRRTRP